MGTYICAAPSGTTDYVVLDNPVADISIGADNTFQIQTTTKVEPRSLIGIPYGSPFGGIVDEVESSSDSPEYTLKGRTWPGVLSDCVVMPPDGKTNLTVFGTVSSCAYDILSAASWPFDATWRGYDSVQLPRITINRFVTAKDAIDTLMSFAHGGYEIMTDIQHNVSLIPKFFACGTSTMDIPAGIDGIQVRRTETTPSVNHLIGLGSGEGTAREICHRYIGKDGEITSSKYYTGPDERTATYDINNDSGSKLIADTEKKLKEYIKPDVVEIKMPGGLNSDFHYPGDPNTGIHIGLHIRVISDYFDWFTATITGGVFKLDASGKETVTWTAKI